MKVALAASTILLLCISAFPEKEHQMERGTVISQNINSSQAGVYNAPIGTASVAVPIYRRTNIVVVETEQYMLEWSESGSNRRDCHGR